MAGNPHTPTTSHGARRVLRTAVIVAATALALLVTTAGEASAVIRGRLVAQGQYPWMVAVTDRANSQFCGGSVVQADVILTAAHCVSDMWASQVLIRAGSVYLNDGAAQVRAVREIRIHPQYSPATDRNDMAVLLLTSPLSLNARVQTIRVPDKVAQATLIDAGSPSTVMGWGSTSDLLGDAPNQLRAASVTIQADGLCNWLWGGGIDGVSMLCASSWTKADACSGDSGGPLVVQDPNTLLWYQAGVVSFGDTCDYASVPGVYADVANLAPFVINRGAGGIRR